MEFTALATSHGSTTARSAATRIGAVNIHIELVVPDKQAVFQTVDANRGLVWFGVSIGVLSALNVTAGATAALVGLLFAFVGGSLLALYQGEDRLPADRRRLLFAQAGQVSKGLILGLFLGFGLRFFDNSVVRTGGGAPG